MEVEVIKGDPQQQFRWTRAEILQLCQEVGEVFSLAELPWNQQQHDQICRDFVEFISTKHGVLFKSLCDEHQLPVADLACLERAVLVDELSTARKKLRIKLEPPKSPVTENELLHYQKELMHHLEWRLRLFTMMRLLPLQMQKELPALGQYLSPDELYSIVGEIRTARQSISWFRRVFRKSYELSDDNREIESHYQSISK